MRIYKKALAFRWVPMMVFIFLLVLISCSKQSDKNVSERHLLSVNNTINLSEAQIQLANIKVSQVKEGVYNFNKIFTGFIKVNEASVTNISSRATGRIVKLFLKSVGQTVNQGDSLYQFYCEDLVAAERQYFTLQSNNWNYNGKYEPSLALENKLLLLGMLPIQIEKLSKNGKILFVVTICSPVKGMIKAINVSEGQYVNDGQILFELADDSKLWVEALVSPEELESVKVGMQSNILVADAGNLTYRSTINFISPALEQGINVAVVRSVINNSNKKLHPGMQALMVIKSDKNRCIMVPSSSVITDKKGSIVWVRNDKGSFTGRNITIGLQSQDSLQVLSGLSKSDFVVTSGAFLLNSELIMRKGTVTDIPTKI